MFNLCVAGILTHFSLGTKTSSGDVFRGSHICCSYTLTVRVIHTHGYTQTTAHKWIGIGVEQQGRSFILGVMTPSTEDDKMERRERGKRERIFLHE